MGGREAREKLVPLHLSPRSLGPAPPAPRVRLFSYLRVLDAPERTDLALGPLGERPRADAPAARGIDRSEASLIRNKFGGQRFG